MRWLTVDVGGTAVKTALFHDGTIVDGPTSIPRIDLDLPLLADWIDRRHPESLDGIAVAVPGNVVDGGRVRYFAAGRWAEIDLAARLRARRPGVRIAIWNDAEAAAASATGLAPAPRLHLTIGTGIGVAALDEGERFVRPHRDGGFIASALCLADGAPVWEAVSTGGLSALEVAHGRDRAAALFADRLASLLGLLVPLFQPRAVTLSGGLLIRLPGLVAAAERRLPSALPHWHAPAFGLPRLVGLPDPVHAGLRGLARLAERLGSPNSRV